MTNHELAHHFYNIDYTYKTMAELFINLIEPKQKLPLIKWLLENGYELEEVNEEINAYLIEDRSADKKWSKFLKKPSIKLLQENLTLLFNERLARVMLI